MEGGEERTVVPDSGALPTKARAFTRGPTTLSTSRPDSRIELCKKKGGPGLLPRAQFVSILY